MLLLWQSAAVTPAGMVDLPAAMAGVANRAATAAERMRKMGKQQPIANQTLDDKTRVETNLPERGSCLQSSCDHLARPSSFCVRRQRFLCHLHADHMGDLPALWVGGTTNNRTVPL